MGKFKYLDIASDYQLWEEYVDTMGLDSREKFDSMSIGEKIAFQVQCFGEEE